MEPDHPWSLNHSKPIKIMEGYTYEVIGITQQWDRIVWYDKDMQKISASRATLFYDEFYHYGVAPEGTRFAVIEGLRPNSTENLYGPTNLNPDEIILCRCQKPNENLVIKDTCTKGYYFGLNGIGSVPIRYQSAFYTDYIDAVPSYTYEWAKNLAGKDRLHLYDKNKQFIGTWDSDDTATGVKTIRNLPNNCSYMRFSGTMNGLDDEGLVPGTVYIKRIVES